MDSSRHLAPEAAPAESELRGLLEFAQQPILVLDRRHRILASNEAFDCLVGRERGTAGRPLSLFVAPASQGLFRQGVDDAFHTGAVPPVPVRIRLVDGQGGLTDHVARLRRSRLGGETVVGVAFLEGEAVPLSAQDTVRDLALPVRPREAVRRPSQERPLAGDDRPPSHAPPGSNLVATGSAEVRDHTRLRHLARAITHIVDEHRARQLSSLELALLQTSLEEPLGQHLGRAKADWETVAETSAILRTYLGEPRPSPAPVDLGTLAAAVATPLRLTLPRGVRLELEIAPDLPRVQGDPDLLRLALTHLVTNASTALCRRGSVLRLVVESQTDVDDQPHVTCFPPDFEEHDGLDAFVTLRVEDDGIGMTAETCEVAFDPFFSLFGRRGLGLSFVLGATHSLGGWVDLDSQPEVGTTIRLHLPVANAA